jgi:nicotinate phosphoribosyltransferase
VGTSLATSEDAPSLDIVYKLVADRGEPRKTSKVTLPGIKQVFRSDAGDVLGLADEEIPGHTALLEPVMIDGERTVASPSLPEIRERSIAAVDALPEALTALDQADRAVWPVTVSAALQGLADRITGTR